jgi:hypothetical protein
MSTTELIAYAAAIVASCLIFLGFFMKTIIPLRLLSMGANAGFLTYGLLTHSWVVVILHAGLLPINLFRVGQMIRLTRRVEEAAAAGDPGALWLRPYMRKRRYKAGDDIFRKGDRAEEVYFLAEGRIEFVEIGEAMSAGRIFGEIAIFTPERRRTQTARCTEASTVLSIDESTLKQLYYQNPEFGFHLVGLIAGRLVRDVQRLEAQLAGRVANPP